MSERIEKVRETAYMQWCGIIRGSAEAEIAPPKDAQAFEDGAKWGAQQALTYTVHQLHHLAARAGVTHGQAESVLKEFGARRVE